jgi:hypothetical protein
MENTRFGEGLYSLSNSKEDFYSIITKQYGETATSRSEYE